MTRELTAEEREQLINGMAEQAAEQMTTAQKQYSEGVIRHMMDWKKKNPGNNGYAEFHRYTGMIQGGYCVSIHMYGYRQASREMGNEINTLLQSEFPDAKFPTDIGYLYKDAPSNVCKGRTTANQAHPTSLRKNWAEYTDNETRDVQSRKGTSVTLKSYLNADGTVKKDKDGNPYIKDGDLLSIPSNGDYHCIRANVDKNGKVTFSAGNSEHINAKMYYYGGDFAITHMGDYLTKAAANQFSQLTDEQLMFLAQEKNPELLAELGLDKPKYNLDPIKLTKEEELLAESQLIVSEEEEMAEQARREIEAEKKRAQERLEEERLIVKEDEEIVAPEDIIVSPIDRPDELIGKVSTDNVITEENVMPEVIVPLVEEVSDEADTPKVLSGDIVTTQEELTVDAPAKSPLATQKDLNYLFGMTPLFAHKMLKEMDPSTKWMSSKELREFYNNLPEKDPKRLALDELASHQLKYNRKTKKIPSDVKEIAEKYKSMRTTPYEIGDDFTNFDETTLLNMDDLRKDDVAEEKVKDLFKDNTYAANLVISYLDKNYDNFMNTEDLNKYYSSLDENSVIAQSIRKVAELFPNESADTASVVLSALENIYPNSEASREEIHENFQKKKLAVDLKYNLYAAPDVTLAMKELDISEIDFSIRKQPPSLAITERNDRKPLFTSKRTR